MNFSLTFRHIGDCTVFNSLKPKFWFSREEGFSDNDERQLADENIQQFEEDFEDTQQAEADES